MRPTFDRDLAVACIQPDRDAAGKFLRRLFHQCGIADGGGADDDAAYVLAQPAFDGRVIADSAADLQRNAHRGQNALDRCCIHRPAGKSAIEIDDVEIREALRCERARLIGRVAVKNSRARHVALF